MKLTKRQAIRECKRLWRLVLEGKAKSKYTALNKLPDHFYGYCHSCPLCEYVKDKTGVKPYADFAGSCAVCPIVEQTGWRCEGDKLHWLRRPSEFASVIMALKE